MLRHNSANKFFDALAAGKPVAINHGGWQADLLEETGAGLVLDSHDIGLAATQLLHALHDQNWLKKAGSRARKLADERFSRNHLSRLLEKVLSNGITNQQAIDEWAK